MNGTMIRQIHRRGKSRGAVAALLLFVLFLTPLSALAAPASGQAIVAEGYVVLNPETGQVILEKNAYERYFPASTTKVMTALMILEKVGSLDEVLTFSEWAIQSTPWDSSTLKPEASPGEQMTVRDALYGLMLASSNECASALAEYAYGSLEAFLEAERMRLTRIGCTGTQFVNAHGYHDENHYTTPYDLALIMAEAVRNEAFLQIASTHAYTIPATNMAEPREVSMGHQMIGGAYDYPYAVAGKTGHTPEAGRCLVTYAVKNGIPLVCVIMKSSDDQFYQDTDKLLTEAFAIEERRVMAENAPSAGEGVISNDGDLSPYELTQADQEAVVIASPELPRQTSRLFRAVLVLTGAAFAAAGGLLIFMLITGVRLLLRRRKKHG